MAHFLENHDEQRIASKLSPPEHAAAAIISYLAPGMRFFHNGQREGRRVRVPVHLRRGPLEENDPTICALYDKLLPIINSPAGKSGVWHLLECTTAWAGNSTNGNFVAYYIEHESGDLLVAVNYANYRGQCFAHLPRSLSHHGPVHLRDLLSEARYERDASDLLGRGLYLDVEGFTAHIFALSWTTSS
jgi:hypothetical protein